MNRKIVAEYLGIGYVEDRPRTIRNTDKLLTDLKKIRDLIADINRLDDGDDIEDFTSIASDLDWYVSSIDDAETHIGELEDLVVEHEQTLDEWATELETRLEQDEVKEIGEIETFNALKGKA